MTITIERVSTEWAVANVAVPKALVEKSLDIWRIDNAIVAGVTREGLIGHARIWFVPVAPLQRKTLKACRMILAECKTRWLVLEAYCKPGPDARFAEFAGMRFTEMREEWARYEA